MMDDMMECVYVAWYDENNWKDSFLYFSLFIIFINLRNVGRVCLCTCYEFLLNIDYAWPVMIFFFNLDDDACMNLWMHG